MNMNKINLESTVVEFCYKIRNIALRKIRALGFFLFLSCSPINAGIFDTVEQMNLAHQKAESLKETIAPGVIVAKNKESNVWEDHVSATLIGKPGDKTTKNILSCAHFFHFNAEHRFIFYDYNGINYEISDIIPLHEDIKNLKSTNDIAIYRLKDFVPFDCKTEIARELEADIHISSVAFGWAIPQGLRIK